jgi:hypothetical protein
VRLPCGERAPAATSSCLIRLGRLAGDCRSVGDDEKTQVELRMYTSVHDRRNQVGGCVCGDDGGDEREGERAAPRMVSGQRTCCAMGGSVVNGGCA